MELTAKFTGSSVATQYNVTLSPQASLVKAVLRGPSGDVRTDRTIILNATSSMDPDDPTNNKEPFQIDWRCERDDFPAPCFPGKEYGIQRGLTWTINGSLLTAGRKYTFTANVKKSGSRSDKASLVITPTAAAIPTGRILRVCGGTCPEKHSAEKDLSLSVVADGGFAHAVVAWSSDQLPDLASFDGEMCPYIVGCLHLLKAALVHSHPNVAEGLPPFDFTGREAGSRANQSLLVDWELSLSLSDTSCPTLAGMSDISIPAANLPVSGSVTVTAKLTKGGSTGTTSITVPISGKPYCSSTSSCLQLDAVSETLPGASWRAQPVNIQDDDVTHLR
jgi:hypothetical protein